MLFVISLIAETILHYLHNTVELKTLIFVQVWFEKSFKKSKPYKCFNLHLFKRESEPALTLLYFAISG